MKAVKRIIPWLFVLALAVLYIIIYTVPGVTGALTKTEILHYGNLRAANSVTCYFIREETVYTARREGAVNYFVGDAVHVKAGTRMLSVEAASQDSYATESNGITSYYIDGYEDYFAPETMRELKYNEVSRLGLSPENVVTDYAFAGDPLYKICGNREWHMVCWVDAGNISKYSIGKKVTAELPLGGVEAEITDIIEDGDRWLIILRSDRYYEDFARVRSVPAEIVTSDESGILVNNASIAASGGAIGVYIKTKSGAFVFKPVKVIATDGDRSLVETSYFYDENNARVGTVNIYDEILVNPERD